MKSLMTLLVALPGFCFAQNFHFAARFGLMNYQGDLNAKAITLSQSRLMGSLGARYDLNQHLSARTYFTYGNLQADDAKGTASMQQRNLSFKTHLLEWEGGLQYHLFNLNNRWWTPYVFLGIGFYHFNSYTSDATGNKYYLAPLSTEGQGFMTGKKAYKLTQFCVPMGFGAQYALNEDMRIGLEFGYRKLLTDYIDDVSAVYVDASTLSTERGAIAAELAYRGDEVGAGPYPSAGDARGNDKNKDGYYYFAVTYSVRYFFDKYKQIVGLPSAQKDKKVGCPATRY